MPKTAKSINVNDVINAIAAFKTREGYTPSKTEIADELDCTRQNVDYHFDRNKEKILKKYPEFKRYEKA